MVATKSDHTDKEYSEIIDLKKVGSEKTQKSKASPSPAVAKKPEAKVQHRISGLSLDKEKEAIAMLDAGRDIAEVMDIFGIARSDIMTLNVKK